MIRVTTLPFVLALTLLGGCGTKDAPAGDASRGKTDGADRGVGAPPVVGTPRGPQGTDKPLPGPPNGSNAPAGDRNSDLGTIVGADKDKADDTAKTNQAAH